MLKLLLVLGEHVFCKFMYIGNLEHCQLGELLSCFRGNNLHVVEAVKLFLFP